MARWLEHALVLLALTGVVSAHIAIPVTSQIADQGKPTLGATTTLSTHERIQALAQMGCQQPPACAVPVPCGSPCAAAPQPKFQNYLGVAPQTSACSIGCPQTTAVYYTPSPYRPEVVIVMDEPTEFPSPAPSSDPTRYPTPVPSQVPTPLPSPKPSPAPTHPPSPSPTDVPTPDPTPNPSTHPTFFPSPVPSPIPSPRPTRVPTRTPTRYPTRFPTKVPTTYTWSKAGYIFKRSDVFGVDERTNLVIACRKHGMWPVCDKASYADGHCLYPHGNWHFSLPRDARRHRLPQHLLKGGYYYAGKANKVWVLKNTGRSHRWSNLRDRGSFTYCTEMKFKLSGFTVERTPVQGIMNSTNIANACIRNGMKPLCDNNRYHDGHCAKIANGNWHISHPAQAKAHKVSAKDILKTKGAFFYAADAHKGKSLMSTGGGHRWSDNSDKNKDTYCVVKNG